MVRAVEDTVAITDSGGDEGVDEGSCSREGERWGESVNVLEVKEGGSAVIVKDDSKV